MEKYKTLKLVGKGSFGHAVLVQSRETPTKFYVIKVIDASKLNKKQKEEALNEIHVLKAMRHPYIITYRESFIEKRCLCIVMDYADGGDLYSKINQQKQKNQYLSEDQILDWFIQIAFAIKHIHDRKILHRDLKTQNIFLTAQGEIKLGDFGIAQVLHHPEEFSKTAIGTPYYLSPEICQEKPYNQKSDIWSLGCILYEMTTLQHAFDGKSITELVKNILHGSYAPIPDEMSDNLRQLIAKMLIKDPAERPSIKEILQSEFLAERISRLLRNNVSYSRSFNEIMSTLPSTYRTNRAQDLVSKSVTREDLTNRTGKENLPPNYPNCPIRCSNSPKRSKIFENRGNDSSRGIMFKSIQMEKKSSSDVVCKNKPQFHIPLDKARMTPDILRGRYKTALSERCGKVQIPTGGKNTNRSSRNISGNFRPCPTNFEYIVQQNLSLLNVEKQKNDGVSFVAKELKTSISTPAIKNQYQIIYNNIKFEKVSRKILDEDDPVIEPSESSFTLPTEPVEETRSSTRKLKDILAKEPAPASLGISSGSIPKISIANAQKKVAHSCILNERKQQPNPIIENIRGLLEKKNLGHLNFKKLIVLSKGIKIKEI